MKHGIVKSKSLMLFLSLSLTACSSVVNTTEVLPPASTATTLSTAIPTTTPTAFTDAAGIGGAGSGDDQSVTTTPDVQVPTETKSEQRELPTCLLGTWSVVHESLVGYLTEAFDQSGLITFNFQTGQGDLFLSFDQDGLTSFRADDLELLVAIPDIADFNFLVQGDGLAQYAADDELIATWGHVSALTSEGGGDIGDQSTDASAVVVLTPEQIFLESTGELATFAWVDVPQDARFTFYTCSENSLILNVDGTLTSEWTRIEEK